MLGPLVIVIGKSVRRKKNQGSKSLCNDFQAVELGSRERLLAFCEAVQRSSPVGSFTKPVAGTTPGYASEVWPFYYLLSIIILGIYVLQLPLLQDLMLLQCVKELSNKLGPLKCTRCFC